MKTFHDSVFLVLGEEATNIGIADDVSDNNVEGWFTLEDDTGIKAFFGDQELAAFVQRVVDPTRWKYLNDTDKAFLRQALGI